MSVVLLATFACVQDPTEVQAPVISEVGSGSGVVQTLQVSMPVSTRTSLGEKVDGKYPVSWSEGDVLAINGKPTTGITIYEETPNVAVFNLPMGITIPYHIVYPYQGENVAVEANSGKYPVVFSAQQLHTEGSFAPNSAPMFAWADGFVDPGEFVDIHMEHLATALRRFEVYLGFNCGCCSYRRCVRCVLRGEGWRRGRNFGGSQEYFVDRVLQLRRG